MSRAQTAASLIGVIDCDELKNITSGLLYDYAYLRRPRDSAHPPSRDETPEVEPYIRARSS
jgi:hypothetical protein